MTKHFLKETDFTPAMVEETFALAEEMKSQRGSPAHDFLRGQSWGMLFYKNSTRTRVSFEVGIRELGGYPLVLDSRSMQIGRGESVQDTARVLGRYLHGLIIRTFGQEVVDGFADYSGLPVVNALTDYLHPCQIFSDVFTIAGHFGRNGADLDAVRGRKVAFLGDTACNMANSWLMAGHVFGLDIALGGPARYRPGSAIAAELDALGYSVANRHSIDPWAAVAGADVVYTDVWVSMGDEAEEAERLQEMKPFQVTAGLLQAAAPGAVFMHCMPAHPGVEVTEEVLALPSAILFDQAENRLHMQKAILAQLAKPA